MDKNSRTYIKITSRVTGIFLKAVDFDTRSMEVVTEHFKKEITETITEDSRSKPCKDQKFKILDTWTTTDIYPFRKVSREELCRLRLSKAPGVVCKDGELLFYTTVPSTLRLNSSASDFGTHMCGKNCAMVCKGCPRTSDLTVSFQDRCGKNFLEAVQQSWRLEKYPFIVSGIEAFNMEGSNDACIVFSCKNYKIRYKEQRKSQSSIDAKLGIAHYFWEDFNGTREEMKERIKRNMDKNRDYQWVPD